MKINGTVIKVGAVQSGTSQQGNPWTRQDVVVSYKEQAEDLVSQSVVISLKGDNVENYKLGVGDEVQVRFGLRHNEWQGRFFLEAWIAPNGLQVISRKGQKKPAPTPQQQTTPTTQENGKEKDDLPF